MRPTSWKACSRPTMCRATSRSTEVGHSFMNDWDIPAPMQAIAGVAGMAYSRPEAEDAWQRIFAFFGEHLR